MPADVGSWNGMSIKIYTAHDSVDAHVISALLRSHDIANEIQGEALMASLGSLLPNAAPTIWVSQASAYRARQLINELLGLPNPTHCERCGYNLSGLPEPICPECGSIFVRVEQVEPSKAWICPKCGESIGGQFTECWKCSSDPE